MKILLSVIFLFFGTFAGLTQDLTAEQLLDKAITYHDPQGNWTAFNGSFSVTMTTPGNSDRLTDIQINLPQQAFTAKAKKDDITTTYSAVQGNCEVIVSDPEAEKPDCQRAIMYRDYYTYLYGLPMKLKDPGTIIDPGVIKKNFKGKDYLVLKATYSPDVGTDVWYFYFDPTTYAMEVYQFFKGDPQGKGKNTGEYILLSEESLINSIKMPKIRAWYYNKDDKYLGTDTLTN